MARPPEWSPSGTSRGVTFDPRFKNTLDYHLITATLAQIREQRHRCRTDIRHLEAMLSVYASGDEALGEANVLPEPQVVASVPAIDFGTYEQLPWAPHSKPANPDASAAGDRGAEASGPGGAGVVRSRKAASSPAIKPFSFNLPWTYEEQKKLEQLLKEYPDEPIAAYRWEKIARALGNRTPKQVGSRVQKYFIRLAQAGLPVPGRLPNLSHYARGGNALAQVRGLDQDAGSATIADPASGEPSGGPEAICLQCQATVDPDCAFRCADCETQTLICVVCHRISSAPHVYSNASAALRGDGGHQHRWIRGSACDGAGLEDLDYLWAANGDLREHFGEVSSDGPR